MSYDIYGNLLQKGHCEVHPWVHHEYPCPVCRDEKSKRDVRQQGPSTIDFQESHTEALKAQLAAKDELVRELVEGLKSIRHHLWSIAYENEFLGRSESYHEQERKIDLLISKASGQSNSAGK